MPCVSRSLAPHVYPSWRTRGELFVSPNSALHTHNLSSLPSLQLYLLFPWLDLPTFPLIFFISVLASVQLTGTLSSGRPSLVPVAVSYLPAMIDIFAVEVCLFLT